VLKQESFDATESSILPFETFQISVSVIADREQYRSQMSLQSNQTETNSALDS
jgi:hypothetical protein